MDRLWDLAIGGQAPQMIARFDLCRSKFDSMLLLQAVLEKKAEHERLSGALAKAKVPVIQYLPPYFKDENMMVGSMTSVLNVHLSSTNFPLL